MDILNDVMQFGLECFASKGLLGLDDVLWEGEKFSSCGSTDQGQVSDCVDLIPKPLLLDCPNVSLWMY